MDIHINNPHLRWKISSSSHFVFADIVLIYLANTVGIFLEDRSLFLEFFTNHQLELFGFFPMLSGVSLSPLRGGRYFQNILINFAPQLSVVISLAQAILACRLLRNYYIALDKNGSLERPSGIECGMLLWLVAVIPVEYLHQIWNISY